MIRKFFKKTFDIRDGEIYISFLMQLYIFLIISALLIIKPTVNALFLSELGADNLPYGYLALAILAIVVSYAYTIINRHFSLRPTIIITLVLFSTSFLLLSGLLYFRLMTDRVLFSFYLVVSLFAVLTTSQYWIFANLVYNAREAKRLFGFIGAGGIAGGIFGGYLTSVLAPVVGNKGLILFAALLILMCIPILQSVWKIRVKKLTVYTRKQLKEVNRHSSYRSSFRLIAGSKHLTYLACIVGVSVMMAKLVDFQFSDFANKAIPDPDDLASFFGFWFSSFNVIAFILQLFLTNRILNRLGVTSTLMILPLGIALGCLLFLTFPELWVLIIIKGMDGSFKQSINKAATELSILPIHFSIKNQAKSYIDVVVDSIATGVSGFLLIFVIRKLELNTSYITIIILFLLFIWMVLIYQLREAYFNSFRENLQKSILFEENHKKTLSKETTSASATRILQSGSDEDILSLLERIDAYKIKSLKESIVALLDHQNTKIKTLAIKQLYSYDKGLAIEKIKSLIQIKDDDLVVSAMEYLMLYTDLKNSYEFEMYLDHQSDYIASAALICLAKEAVNNNKLKIKYHLEQRIAAKVSELTSASGDEYRNAEIAQLLMTIAYANSTSYYSIITANLINQDEYLTKKAIKAAGITKNDLFVDELLNLLAVKPYRKSVIKSLKNYGSGIIKTITILDKNENIRDRSRPYIPKIIEAFRTQEAVVALMRLLRSKDLIIRLQASKSLLKLKQRDRERNLRFNMRSITRQIGSESVFYAKTIRAIMTLTDSPKSTENFSDGTSSDQAVEQHIAREGLIELLNLQLEQSLQCLFQLLSLRYDPTDMQTVYLGLVNAEREAKTQALEFLDNLLHIKLKEKILPYLEFQISSESSVGLSLLHLKPLTEKKCISLLIKNRGRKMKLATINLIQFSDDSSFIKVLRPLLKHKNTEVATMAANAIDRLSKSVV